MKGKNLLNVLSTVFSKDDAFLLAELLKDNLDKETIRHDEIDIVENLKKDLMLLVKTPAYF